MVTYSNGESKGTMLVVFWYFEFTEPTSNCICRILNSERIVFQDCLLSDFPSEYCLPALYKRHTVKLFQIELKRLSYPFDKTKIIRSE